MSPQESDDRDRRARDELAAALGAEDDVEAIAFTDAAAEVAMSLPPVPPSPASKAALLARINALRGETSDQDSASDSDSGSAGARARVSDVGARDARRRAPGSRGGASTHPPSRGARRRPRRPVIALSAIAAALVLFFGGFASRGLLNGPGTTPTANAAPVLAILGQPDALRASETISSGGTATLVWSATAGRAAIILDAANPAPSGKSYELWFIRSGTAIPAGLVSGRADTPIAMELSGELKAGDDVAITVEPARGSPQPTTKPIVVIPTHA